MYKVGCTTNQIITHQSFRKVQSGNYRANQEPGKGGGGAREKGGGQGGKRERDKHTDKMKERAIDQLLSFILTIHPKQDKTKSSMSCSVREKRKHETPSPATIYNFVLFASKVISALHIRFHMSLARDDCS